MSTMNISLPDELRDAVEAQVARHHYGSTSEYVRELIRRDLDRARLRDLILAGAASPSVQTADEGYMDGLRARARGEIDA